MNFIIAEVGQGKACKIDDLYQQNVLRRLLNLDAGGDEKLKINFMWPYVVDDFYLHMRMVLCMSAKHVSYMYS